MFSSKQNDLYQMVSQPPVELALTSGKSHSKWPDQDKLLKIPFHGRALQLPEIDLSE
jgi:hypothetical protein